MNGAPDPTRYLAGGSPRAVIIPARIARLLDREIGHKRAANRGLDREITEVLEAIHLAGLEYAAANTAGGTSEFRQDVGNADSVRGVGLLDTVAVAERLGCTPRNVRALATRGRLDGDCVSGRWLFAPETIDGFIANRAND